MVGAALAADAELTVIPSATEITEKENLSIEFKVVVDGIGGGNVGSPKFEAPDFDELNMYQRSQGMETRLINGKLTVRQTQSVVSVLVPKKTGQLKISNIQIAVGGKTVRAGDITIDVKPEGARTNNPGLAGPGYGGQRQLPGMGVNSGRQQAGSFFIRTEPNKLKAYKGEQIILTYALYTRVNILNVQVERYPTITGYLKEDIDIPLLRSRLDYSPSVVNGQEYKRAVLAQYALYPLKEGNLPIDVFSGKFSYQVGSRANLDEDDPFAILNQFFHAMQTTTQVKSSDRVSIEVLPLPAAGQPANFSGLVGDFEITAVADKQQVKAGEPINLKVKVEGKGHAGSLEQLSIKWPQDFELYEDKSQTQFMRTGHTERIFDYLVIPKVKGRYEIPPIEISMFNPDTRSYQTRHTESITVEVLEGSGGNIYTPKTQQPGLAEQREKQDIRYWMNEAPAGSGTMLRSVARGVAMASMILAAFSLFSLGTGAEESARQKRAKRNIELRARAATLVGSAKSPAEKLAEVEAILGEALEAQYGISIGSLTRPEIRQALTEGAAKDETLAKRVEALLELCENSRYAPGGGDHPTAVKASEELTRIFERLIQT